jgi:hypothetical protein
LPQPAAAINCALDPFTMRRSEIVAARMLDCAAGTPESPESAQLSSMFIARRYRQTTTSIQPFFSIEREPANASPIPYERRTISNVEEQ